MRRIFLVTAALLALGANLAWAQATPEFRPFIGSYIPTGDQRDVLKDAFLMGGQVGVEMTGNVHLVGTLAYSAPRPEQTTIGKDVHLYQYDVGAELFRVMPM
jgi:hypothetical protein